MISAAYLRERLDYDPSTGEFIWKDHADFPKNWRCWIGRRAGATQAGGYRQIRINGDRYKAHRLACVHHYGIDPGTSSVDHIDGNPANNAISNLRLADEGENARNRAIHRNNKSGHKNVAAHSSGKWQVQVKYRKATYFFGTFDTVEEAAAVANAERARLRGAFARAA